MVDFDPRTRFAHTPVARLATASLDGLPHLVPVVFALHDEVIYTAIDAKPKTTQRLRRLANIERNPQVSVLVDHYDEDWQQLWWVRADGRARVEKAAPAGAVEALVGRYEQYRDRPPQGAFIVVEIQRFSTWRAAYSADGSNPLQQ